MMEFFAKNALTLKITALVAAGIAVVSGVSIYAATRSDGQDLTDGESMSDQAVEAIARMEETSEPEETTEMATAEPATEVTTRKTITREEQEKIAEEVAKKAESVKPPSEEDLEFTPEKDREDQAAQDDGGPVDVEDDLDLPAEDPTGGDANEDTPPAEPEAPVLPDSPVKYQIYRTLEGSGFSPTMNTTWASTHQFYNDGKPVDSWKGIDISYAQGGSVDFNAIKAAGTDFVIIRAGARGYETGAFILDRYFDRNIEAASAAGLDIGVYFYSQAITEEEAIEEAKFVLQKLGEHPDVEITYPVIIDVEGTKSHRIWNISKAQRNKNVIAFCEVIRQAGYYPMVYSDQNFSTNMLDFSQLPYDYWMACYRDKNTNYATRIPFTMWQYTSSGRVSGISGNVDLNVSLVDYATYLRKNGWNKLK